MAKEGAKASGMEVPATLPKVDEKAVLNINYGKYGGMGMEDAPADGMPILKVASDRMAAYAKEGSPIYQCKNGTLWFTGNDALYEWCHFYPVYMHRLYQQWATGDGTDGAPMASYDKKPDGVVWVNGNPAENKRSGNRMPDGTWINETHFWYGLIKGPSQESVEGAVLFSKSSLAVSREMKKIIKRGAPTGKIGEYQPAPSWAQPWRLMGKTDTDGSKVWWTWSAEQTREYMELSHPLFAKCVAFHAKCREYVKSLDLSDPRSPVNVAAAGDDMPF